MRNRYRDPSALSQVHEWLAAQPVGTVIWSSTAHAALPHLKPVNISAALSLLASPRYGVLTKLPKQGRYQPYRVSSFVLTTWNGHCAPQRQGGEKRPHDAKPAVSDATRAQVAELLLDAAAAVEAGDEVDKVLDAIRRPYYLLKGRK